MPRKKNANGAYTIAMVGANDAEINLYGEVVDCRPVDLRTNEPIPGNFIALDDFLKDLDELNGKDNIFVHINSVGGSLYAGLTIYNRLKAMPGKVITICDALAASAASIIFMAGDVRKMNAGSNLMIHEAAHFAYGYYRVKDHEDDIKQLEAHNKTAVAVYAERTGNSPEEIKIQLKNETWLTGQEAVDAGYADEVIESADESVTMSLSPDKRFIVSNGVTMYTGGMTMPAAVAVMTEEQAEEYIRANKSVSPFNRDTNKIQKDGGKGMKKNKNDEIFRRLVSKLESEEEERDPETEYEEEEEQEQQNPETEYEEEEQNPETEYEEEEEENPEAEGDGENVCPVCGMESEFFYTRNGEIIGCEQCVDVVTNNNTAAKNSITSSIKKERRRIRDIEAIEAAIGDKKMVRDAKYGKNPLTAEQLAFKAMQAQAAIGATVFSKMKSDSRNSGVRNVRVAPTVNEKKMMTDDEKAVALLVGAINKKEDK